MLFPDFSSQINADCFHLFKTLHTVSLTGLYVDQTMNVFFIALTLKCIQLIQIFTYLHILFLKIDAHKFKFKP